jgi:hypothetical protein
MAKTTPAAKDKAPAAARAPKPAAPNITDKFGLLLLVLVLLMLVGNFVVWGMAGWQRNGVTLFNSGMFAETAAEYDARVPQARVISYQSTGIFGRLPGQVDMAVINRGSADGVRVGDVFTPLGLDGKYFAQFSVTDVAEASCTAVIATNLLLEQDSPAGTAGLLVNEVKPDSTPLERKVKGQEVRNKIVPLGS